MIYTKKVLCENLPHKKLFHLLYPEQSSEVDSLRKVNPTYYKSMVITRFGGSNKDPQRGSILEVTGDAWGCGELRDEWSIIRWVFYLSRKSANLAVF